MQSCAEVISVAEDAFKWNKDSISGIKTSTQETSLGIRTQMNFQYLIKNNQSHLLLERLNLSAKMFFDKFSKTTNTKV